MAGRAKPNQPLGFTVIELLVVIAIIVVIAAITFPVMQRSRVSGYQASTASNLRSVNFAYQLYLQDSDDHLANVSDDCYHLGKVCHGYPPVNAAYMASAPGISGALRTYGSVEDIWKIPVGYGLIDFEVKGADYFYPYGLPGFSNHTGTELMAKGCPLIYEADHYIYDGGHLPVTTTTRYMTVFLDGNVGYLIQAKVHRPSDDCVHAFEGVSTP